MLHTPSGDVLIVDDDPVIVDMLTDSLSKEGYAVRRVYNGVEGLMAIAAEPPGLVLLDLQLPYLHGGAVLAQVRAAHPDLPSIVITAAPDQALPLLEPYHVTCMSKPFDLDALFDCVAQYMPPVRLANGD